MKKMAKRKYESEVIPDAGYTEPTYAWVYCEKIDKPTKMFGDTFVSIENCAVVIPEGKGKPCKTRDGRDAICFEHIAIYEQGSPVYNKKKS